MQVFILNLSLSLIVTIKSFQKLLHVQFSCCGPDLGTLFENLTAKVGSRIGLETLLCFKSPGNFRVDIIRMQRLALG